MLTFINWRHNIIIFSFFSRKMTCFNKSNPQILLSIKYRMKTKHNLPIRPKQNKIFLIFYFFYEFEKHSPNKTKILQTANNGAANTKFFVYHMRMFALQHRCLSSRNFISKQCIKLVTIFSFHYFRSIMFFPIRRI